VTYEPRTYLTVVRPLRLGDLRGTAFWLNCKRVRRAGGKICEDCPFREEIERAEREGTNGR